MIGVGSRITVRGKIITSLSVVLYSIIGSLIAEEEFVPHMSASCNNVAINNSTTAAWRWTEEKLLSWSRFDDLVCGAGGFSFALFPTEKNLPQITSNDTIYMMSI
jgi:hypothetical protein